MKKRVGVKAWWSGVVRGYRLEDPDEPKRVVLSHLSSESCPYSGECSLPVSPALADLDPLVGDTISFQAKRVDHEYGTRGAVFLEHAYNFVLGQPPTQEPVTNHQLPTLTGRWIRLSVIAPLLEKSVRTLERWAADGKIPAKRRGSFWYVDAHAMRKSREYKDEFDFYDKDDK